MKPITFDQLPQAVTELHEILQNIEKLLLEKNNEPKESEQFLNIQQTAELICLSVPTIYGLVCKAEIPVCKRGKRLYFSKQELISWIKTGRKKTTKEMDNAAKIHETKKSGRG